MNIKRRYIARISVLITCMISLCMMLPDRIDKDAEALFIQQNSLPADLAIQANKLLGDPVISDAITNRKKDVLRNAGFTLHKTFWGNVVAEHPDMPGWIIKGPKPTIVHNLGFLKNIVRIKGAYTLRAAIKKYNYDNMLLVPKEYFFHYTGRDNQLNDTNYCIVSEKIDIIPKDLSTLPRETTDALLKVVKEAHFFDPKEDNFCITADGKIALMDTEQFSTNYWINELVGFILDTTYRILNIHIESVVNKKTTPNPQV